MSHDTLTLYSRISIVACSPGGYFYVLCLFVKGIDGSLNKGCSGNELKSLSARVGPLFGGLQREFFLLCYVLLL